MNTNNLTLIAKIKYGLSMVVLIGVLSQILMPQTVLAFLGGADIYIDPALSKADFNESNVLPISQDCALIATVTTESPVYRLAASMSLPKKTGITSVAGKVVGQRWAIVTAYSSTVDQCDASPFITAKGTMVRDGIVATNFLPFGTKITFPLLYPGKVFVVEDRMALKNSHKVDIWFPSRGEAIQFGVKYTQIEVVQ